MIIKKITNYNFSNSANANANANARGRGRGSSGSTVNGRYCRIMKIEGLFVF
jgi:hypothetical protein